MDDLSNRSFNFHLHCWAMIHDCLSAYSAKKYKIFLQPCLDIAIDWITRYVDIKNGCPIIDENHKNHAWYDMAVGLRAQKLAYLLDVYLHDVNSQDEIANVLWQGLLAHQYFLSEDANFVYHNNHGYYQAAGQMAMGRRFGSHQIMQVAYAQGIERFNKMLAQQYTDEGVHREHSPDYHRMVLSTLKGVIESGLVSDDEILKKRQKIESALSWFIMPNGHITNFGDSDYRFMAVKPKQAIKKWQDPTMQYVTSNGKVGCISQDGLMVFKEAGYFIYRKNQKKSDVYSDFSYLAQIAGFHSRTHKHADDLSFVWYDKGCNILIDAGRYGYVGKANIGSELWLQGYWYTDPKRLYCESTHAHNTLEFDGQNYPRKGVKPYGSAIGHSREYDNGMVVLETKCKHFKSIRRERVLIYMPNHWLIVFDWFKDNLHESHDVRQWFNFAPNISVGKIGNGYYAKLDKKNELHICNLLEGMVASDVINGQEEPRMQGWFSPAEKELMPINSINYIVEQLNTASMATLFNFNGKTDIALNNNQVNISGRRLFVEWFDKLGKHQLTLRRESYGQIDVKYSIIV